MCNCHGVVMTVHFVAKIRSKRRTRSSTSSKTRRTAVRVISGGHSCLAGGTDTLCAWCISCLCAVGKKVATKEKRWYKDVGLGFKTPSEAISGTYIGAHTLRTEVVHRPRSMVAQLRIF